MAWGARQGLKRWSIPRTGLLAWQSEWLGEPVRGSELFCQSNQSCACSIYRIACFAAFAGGSGPAREASKEEWPDGEHQSVGHIYIIQAKGVFFCSCEAA